MISVILKMKVVCLFTWSPRFCKWTWYHSVPSSVQRPSTYLGALSPCFLALNLELLDNPSSLSSLKHKHTSAQSCLSQLYQDFLVYKKNFLVNYSYPSYMSAECVDHTLWTRVISSVLQPFRKKCLTESTQLLAAGSVSRSGHL